MKTEREALIEKLRLDYTASPMALGFMKQAADMLEADGKAQQAQRPLTDEEIEVIAHRTASKYTHRSDPAYHSYGFVKHTLIDFARKVRGEA